ncbi:MAG TPA: methyltransferase domain-containing protein, partial [Armatimonadota bacterium]|nr:methyltransferase domain-containing protein [Armatimonadota bacterium]
AALEGIYLRLITCDMREIDFDSEFDLVINLFTSFGYLETDEEDQKVLNAVARALKPGGRFLIDVQNRDALMKQFIPRHWEETADGRILLAYRCFDPISGRINCREICIYPDGRRKETGHSIRLYTYNELDRMLKSAGLTTISAWGDFEGSRFTPETERMILLSEKLAG